MDAVSFAYWLKGFFEISDAKTVDEKQVQIIKDHLNLVFNKVTPDRIGVASSDSIPKGFEDFDLMPKSSLYCTTSTGGLNPSQVLC
jgi:hypothetical protein